MSKFYKCKSCGSIVFKIECDNKLSCCNNELEEIKVNYEENEKHSPVVSFSNNLMNICIGNVHHPMEQEHSIEWVYIEYSNGGEFIYIKDEPTVTLNILGREIKKVYSYCNLHGLYVKEIKE